MGMKAVTELFRRKQLLPLLQLSRMLVPFYRLSYVSALVSNGYFSILANKSVALNELMAEMGIEKENSEGLEAWLQVGIRLKEISLRAGKYGLQGVSKKLANVVENDALLAITQEVTTLHHKLLLETPEKLKNGERWRLSDQDGELIARSSRILEPFQYEVIETIFSTTGATRLLEVGCGSGIYIKQATMKNPQLTAVGVELQTEVANMARHNIEQWQLEDRVQIESGDIREKDFGNDFDIVTLYNNIYYFPVAERVALLKRLKSFLKPGGFLVLITGCQGGPPLMELLNLWGVTTSGCARLPDVEEMVSQMKAAGFDKIQTKNLLSGGAFYAFIGYRAGVRPTRPFQDTSRRPGRSPG